MPQSRDKAQEPLAGVNLVEMEIDRVNVQLNLANHIPVPPGKAEPPDFTGDESEFEDFVDRNFPRRKYASLRRNLDKAARRKVITPIELYRYIAHIGRLLRAVTAINDAYAQLKGKCPVLRICVGCGKIFEPFRKDKMHCSDTCHDRLRQANLRYRKGLYKENRVRKEDERENQTKARPRK